MTMIPPPDDDDFDVDYGVADTIALAQCVLIAMLVIALIVFAPVAHPEWFTHLYTSGQSAETR